MSPIVYRITNLLCRIIRSAYLGTNLGLLSLLWTLLSGRLLRFRGAIIPALSDFGLEDKAVRRSWASLCYGKWQIRPMIEALGQIVQEEGRWQAHRYGGRRVVACDLVGFFRPHLQNCPAKHYSSEAGKALPAISLGIAVSVGSVDGKRVPVLRTIVRTPLEDEQDEPQDRQTKNKGSESALKVSLLKEIAQQLEEDEALVCDAGFELSQIQAADISHYILRCANNFTARRNELPEYTGRGRPYDRGAIVRPLPRTFKGKTLPATPADREERWTVSMADGKVQMTLRAEFWDNLVRSDAKLGNAKLGNAKLGNAKVGNAKVGNAKVGNAKVGNAKVGNAKVDAPSFSCMAIYDPRYEGALLLAMEPGWNPEDARQFYLDRWPVEQVPLSAKQMIGASRSFVFATESSQRLPELSLLAGSILSYVSATMPAISTGFWDRKAHRTSGRLRRVLEKVHFENLGVLPAQIRKKQSITAHLPKGIKAHRRSKAPRLGSASPQVLDVAA